ncbi:MULTISPECIES: aminopeptidase P family protein [unclassified Arthrobacter]|uniref:aminopeptidase P family protein n=1 Tax=unclassified Arthrobacter TaxID=235627 RepID=UPI001C8548EC|nr:aminopeptidase P family protein [Arthrobacter sp. MAHUQ-56]MBX7444624.1 M24 family metallopeptidase [Arthrobacter sp. MAHUQ-56]
MKLLDTAREIPTLTTRERDRRWNMLRELMEENDVDCLLVPPTGFDGPDTYITNDSPGSTVIFPRIGEPTAIQRGGFVAGGWLQAHEWDEESWVRDMRFHPGVPSIAAILKEKGLEKGRIGTIGVLGGTHLNPHGWTPAPMWAKLQEALPDAEFVELVEQFVLRWMVKSDDELVLHHYVAGVAEAACQVMLEETKVGANEADIYAAVMGEIYRRGVNATPMNFHSGKGNLSWARPRWLARPQKPRTIENGDVILSELFATVGNVEASAQMCIGVGDVDESYIRAAKIARECYEQALATMRPGIRFEELALAMSAPLEPAGAWQLTPQIHSQSPLQLVSRVSQDIDVSITSKFKDVFERPIDHPDVILKPGMLFQVEANASIGRSRVNIGGNMYVSEDGCVELNSLPTEMRFVHA